jgi:ABC-type antimicrobial peptide transport system permease subunit
MPGFVIKLLTTWQFVLKRGLANWKLMSAVLLGVLLASAIMSGTVIYFDALRELALRHTINGLSVREIDILAQGQRAPTTRADYNLVANAAEREFEERIDWLLNGRMQAGKSPTFFLTEEGQEEAAGKDNSRAYFAFLPQLDEHTTLATGRRPVDQPLEVTDDTLTIEAMIPQDAADLFGLVLGDRVVAVPHWDDSISSVTVEISGTFTRNDPTAEFWALEDRVLSAATGPSFRTAPFLISEAGYLDVLGPAFRKMDSTYAWLLSVDGDRINAANSISTLNKIQTMNASLASTLTGYRQETKLDNALVEYDRRLFFSKLPMFVVLILIAVVILYYVITLSSLAVEERRSEVALLRSRGASTAQILTIFVMEGTTISLVAMLAGPVLAAAAVGALGYTPAFSDLTGGTRVVASISGAAYMMSVLGGVLSFVALIVPAVQASRISVTRHRQQSARPTSQPAYQRYYLDVLGLVIGIFLFRQLTEQGSVVATKLFGELAVNQLLLALPGLILVASAMVLLRLFPVVMNLASRLFSSWLPAGMVMGIWQMARNPTHYARLSLLLILTAGLGIFASSFGATLERSFEERVLYSTGSDLRVADVRESFPTTGVRRSWRRSTPTPVPTPGIEPTPRPTLSEAYLKVPGIEVASPVLRSSGHDLSRSFGTSYTMLALDSESFTDVAWYRDDFSDEPIDELILSLGSDESPQILELPEDALTFTVVLKSDRPHPTVRVTARLRDATGRYRTLSLGALNSADWTVLSANLAPGGYAPPRSSVPISLISLRIDETGAGRRLQAGSIIVDEISVGEGDEQFKVVESFDDTSRWSVLRVTSDAVSDSLRDSGVSVSGDGGSALFSWSSGNALTSRGLYYGPTHGAIPVLASKSFMRNSGHTEGEEFDVSVAGFRIPVIVTETVDYFPTMTLSDQKYLIADLTSVTNYANLGASSRNLDANELWLSTAEDGASPINSADGLGQVGNFSANSVLDRNVLLAESQVDPLVKAGWRALLFIAFGAVLILSCLGFLVHAYVSFRNRQLQFALLRTVGLSSGQLITMVWLEQTLVIAAGMALGTWMGGRLGSIIMPFLGHDDFGTKVLPPFALEVNWGALFITYGIMVFVFAVITLGIIWLIHRISVQRILRLGEM